MERVTKILPGVLIVLLLLAVSVGYSQEIKRPTVDASGGIVDYGCGVPTYSACFWQAPGSMPLAYDSGTPPTTTYSADSISNIGGGCDILTTNVFNAWSSPSGSYSALTLNINAACSTNDTHDQKIKCAANYYNGSTWNTLFTTSGASQQTYTVTIPTSTDFTKLKIGTCLRSTDISSTGDGGGTGQLQIFDIWTSGTLPPVTYTLTVTPPTNGTIAGGAINCGSTCSQTSNAGTQVTLSANPNSGYVFSGWTGACSGTGTCVVTLNSNQTVGANFSPTTPVSITTSSPLPDAIQGQPYFQIVGASGGSGSYTWSVASGFADAACHNLTATSSGTVKNAIGQYPDTPGTCNWVYQVTDGYTSASKSFSLTVDPATLNVSVSINGAGSGSVGSGCAGTVSYGAQVSCVATPSTGSGISEVYNTCQGSGPLYDDSYFSPPQQTPYTITTSVIRNCTIQVTFVVASYVLTAAKAGTGTGTIYGSGGSNVYNCGTGCAETDGEEAPGNTVVFTAIPDSGSVFSGWSGGGCSGNGTCTVTVNSNTTITATFTAKETLTVAIAGSGSGSVVGSGGTVNINCPGTCSETELYGTTGVTLAASPGQYSTFGGWSGGGCSGTGTCIPSFTSNSTVTATFNPPSVWTLSATNTGNGTGTITGAGSIGYGSIYSLTLTPGTGSHLVSASGCGGTLSGNIFSGTMPNNNCSVSVVFTLDTHTLTVATNGGSGTGSVTGCSTGTYNYGTQFSCGESAASGSYFVGWVGTGSVPTSSQSLTISFSLTSDSTLTANFGQLTTISTNVASGSGSIVATSGSNCAGSWQPGSSFSCTASPSTGYYLASLSGCGGTASGGVLSGVVPSSSCTVTANFSLQTHTLTVVNGGSGAGSVAGQGGTVNINCGSTCSESELYGTNITLTATPTGASSFGGWSGGGCSGTGTCGFNFNADATVTATFNPPAVFSLTSMLSGTGSGSVSGTGSYATGSTYSITITPSTGSAITSVTGCGGTLNGTTYTGTMPGSNCTVAVQFDLQSFTLTLNASFPGSVTWTGVNCASGTYLYNTTILCNSTANPGYSLSGISGTGAASLCMVGACQFNLTSASTITATVTGVPSYTFTVLTSGVGSGTVSCSSGTYLSGTSIGPCTATAAQGSIFTGWTGTGNIVSVSGTGIVTFTITANSTLTANFSNTPPPVFGGGAFVSGSSVVGCVIQ